MKKTRIIDVANHAGVSKSTVSQYLNRRFEYMSEDTKMRIGTAIEDLNYIPNPIARSLKTDKTKTIGVMVSAITGVFTGQVLRGIDDFCKKNDYNVLIYNTDFDPDVERKALFSLKQMRVDGLIIASCGYNNELFAAEEKAGFPITQVHIEFDDLKTNIVLSDYRSGGFEATEYLIKLGHKRICFLTQEYENVRSRLDRYLGYKEALDKYNIGIDPELIQVWDRDRGFTRTPDEILKMENPPTAFFSMQLNITYELLMAIDATGKKIPEDISVIGFHEIPMVELLKVPLTVIRQSPYDIGTESAKLLLEKISEGYKHIKRVVLPCTFIERESCGPPPVLR